MMFIAAVKPLLVICCESLTGFVLPFVQVALIALCESAFCPAFDIDCGEDPPVDPEPPMACDICEIAC